MASLDFLSFLISSILAIALVFYKVPTTVLQQGIALILVILLIISRRFLFPESKISGRLFRFILLVLSALFVQLIVISSGGFYSPFLIILHLYTLGTSFILKISSAISFLILSLIILFASTFLNKTLLTLFQQDPGSAVIYLVSFVVIIPLAQFLISTYNLKDTISKLLSEHIDIGEKREQSILSGLEEMVIVTGVDLGILSFNGAVEKTLKLPGEILGRNLLDVVRLKGSDGKPATDASLSINKVLKDRVTHLVDGFSIETKSASDFKVSIQIRPVTNLEGQVNQIVFLITDARPTGMETHSEFGRAQAEQKAMFGEMREVLVSANLKNESIRMLLLEKNEDDLFIAQELSDHPFRKMIKYQDLFEVCQLVVAQRNPLARALGVTLRFEAEDNKEQAYLSLKLSNLSPGILPPSEYSVPSDPKWLKVLVEKLIDIAIFLPSGPASPASGVASQGEQPNASVSLFLDKGEDQNIIVSINASPVQISEVEKEDLMKQYYGNLMSKTNLRLGSGLEGFIAKTISLKLNLPIKTEVMDSSLIFTIQMSKEIHS